MVSRVIFLILPEKLGQQLNKCSSFFRYISVHCLLWFAALEINVQYILLHCLLQFAVLEINVQYVSLHCLLWFAILEINVQYVSLHCLLWFTAFEIDYSSAFAINICFFIHLKKTFIVCFLVIVVMGNFDRNYGLYHGSQHVQLSEWQGQPTS